MIISEHKLSNYHHREISKKRLSEGCISNHLSNHNKHTYLKPKRGYRLLFTETTMKEIRNENR